MLPAAAAAAAGCCRLRRHHPLLLLLVLWILQSRLHPLRCYCWQRHHCHPYHPCCPRLHCPATWW